jgi:aromatic ring-opening dioxygenase catalytic subunit (LigB family)
MTAPPTTGRTPTFFIPHGGGPCFFMDWTMGPPDTWDRMGAWLKTMSSAVGPKPAAILVISAHWEEPEFTVTGAANPPLLYDYYGFPEHTYRLRYGAPGSPELAQEVRDLLGKAGIASRTDTERGFDHGVFIPFLLIYPDADIPVVQLSLKANLDPAEHIAAGKALAPLRDRNVLIVGSGMSYHNLSAFMRGLPPTGAATFDTWLTDAATDTDIDRRDEKLAHWANAPAARDAHPREEHLIPLMVAAGAAGADVGRQTYSDSVMGSAISAYQFG